MGVLFINEPKVISENRKEKFNAVAESLEIELPTDFYNLGQLETDKFASLSILGGASLKGNKDEKLKYNKFVELEKLISDFIGWKPFEELFQNLNCLRLILSNDGNLVDEDIDITLRFSKDMIITHNQLPKQEKDTLHSMDTYICLDDIFSIRKSQMYDDYVFSKRFKY
ncbi:MAG TPA: hypothetical protein IAC41_11515, partial [Candidatus Merdenecus merdavium]|nr:hypothetical protein [Candidatus Merdenecus merdavium]